MGGRSCSELGEDCPSLGPPKPVGGRGNTLVNVVSLSETGGDGTLRRFLGVCMRGIDAVAGTAVVLLLLLPGSLYSTLYEPESRCSLLLYPGDGGVRVATLCETPSKDGMRGLEA